MAETLHSGWLTSGPKVQEFQKSFAAAVDAPFAVALNSATAALHLALLAHGIGAGDEVIVPTMTFAATAEVVIAVGATPVLVDCRSDTLQIDVDHVRSVLSEKTRAIMPVHYGGSACEIDELVAITDERDDIRIIEDAAHAFPSRSSTGQMIGSIGDATCFSFYANKTITTGEGGMLTTSSEEIADAVRRLSLHGLSRDAWNRFDTRAPWDYDIVEPGWKYNMTDSAAALGLRQLERAEGFAARRREIHEIFDAEFKGIEGIEPRVAGPIHQGASHLYVVRVKGTVLRKTRDDLIRAFAERGIGTSVHYRPLHMHTYYREQLGYDPDDLPHAASAFGEIVSLPIFPSMTNGEVEVVIDAVRVFAEGGVR